MNLKNTTRLSRRTIRRNILSGLVIERYPLFRPPKGGDGLASVGESSYQLHETRFLGFLDYFSDLIELLRMKKRCSFSNEKEWERLQQSYYLEHRAFGQIYADAMAAFYRLQKVEFSDGAERMIPFFSYYFVASDQRPLFRKFERLVYLWEYSRQREKMVETGPPPISNAGRAPAQIAESDEQKIIRLARKKRSAVRIAEELWHDSLSNSEWVRHQPKYVKRVQRFLATVARDRINPS